MAVQTGFLGSSIVKKYWMALTGLFLIIFLIVHLIGNLPLMDLSQEGREQFNAYSAFMTGNPLIKTVSYILYFSILFHSFDGLYLALKNRKARPQRYRESRPGRNSIWASRNMGVLGTAILVFIVLHMGQFWYPMHWGPIGEDALGQKDLATVVVKTFTDSTWGLPFVLIYVISMLAIAFHLWHGFESSFQSLGLNHPRYTPVIQGVGRTFAIIVPLLFAIIPVYLYINA